MPRMAAFLRCVFALALLSGCRDVKPLPTHAFDGGWYQLELPTGWQSCSWERHAAFELCLQAPTDALRQPNLLLTRPVQTTQDAVAFVADQVTALTKAVPVTTRTPTLTPFAGSSGAVAPIAGETPEGLRFSSRLWGVTGSGFGLALTCGASGELTKVADKTCDVVAASLRVTGELPLSIPDVDGLVRKPLGPLTARVPPTWTDVAQDPRAARVEAGYVAPEGSSRVRAALLLSSGPAANAAAFADAFEPLPQARRLARFTAEHPSTSVVALEFDEGRTRSVIYHFVAAGRGYRLWCLASAEHAKYYRPVCDEVLRSVELPSAPDAG